MVRREFVDKTRCVIDDHVWLMAIIVTVLGLSLTACSELSSDGSSGDTTIAPTVSAIAIPIPTPTAIPTPKAGNLRTNPVPYGASLSHGNLEVTVLETLEWESGELLFESVKREGKYTSTTRLQTPDAGEGFVWLVVRVRLRNVGNPNETMIYTPTHFKVTGRSGSIYEVADLSSKQQRHPLSFVESLERNLGRRYLDSGEFFGDSELTGHLIARVAVEDDDFVLIHTPGSQDSKYLSLKNSTASESSRGSSEETTVRTWPEPPLGTGRTNPVPYGASFTHNDIEVTILEVARLAKEGSFFPGLALRKAPDEGNHYIGIKLRLRNVGDQNETRSYSKDFFRVTGELGFVYDEVRTPEVGEFRLYRGEFFGGGEITGVIALQVPARVSELVLIYSPPLLGSSYYSLEAP